jgi:hypothetical protein
MRFVFDRLSAERRPFNLLAAFGSCSKAQGGVSCHLVDRSLMPSTWRKHLTICLFLGLLAIPIYFLDLASTGGGGGNWIALDFRGLIFWTYIILVAVHVVLSSIGVLSFPKSGLWRIHLGSMVLSLVVLVMGFIIYGKLLRAQAIAIGSQSFRFVGG